MGLWDDIKRAAGNVKDEVADVFDGDEKKPQQKTVTAQRPDYEGKAFRTVNAAFAKRKDEFEKPLWMQGADHESPYSSWDSTYLDRLFKQQERLTKEGKLNDQFEDENKPTGIVTWDHNTKDGKQLKFGDVFDNGKLVGNLYEDKDGTEADADLMMGQFLLEPEELAKIGSDRDPTQRLRMTIEEKRQNNNIEIPQALGAAEQQVEVDKKQSKIQGAFKGKGDDLLSGGLGATGGAVLGGGIGAAFGGVGAIPGAAIGAGIGGLAAWLNRDDISEQVASAEVITRKAYDDEQGNAIGDFGSSAKQWAGVAGRGLSPLSNLVRGAVDTERGNGIGALQEEDRPAWAKPVDIAATVADMGFTFGSRAGIAAYTGQMGVHSAGALTELTLGGGLRWDPRAGEFRNVYKDEQGDVSLANAGGAWLSTGIDVAQLAMVRGIASKIAGAETKAIGSEVGGGTVASVEERAGRTFYLDADKKVLDSKINFSQAFVPSEGVQLLAASGMARTANRAAATTKDDLYKASVSLARAESPIKAALVNAVGEGTEEAVQEALDTWSFDHQVDLQSLAEAYAYGAASGLGMGFAANYRTRDSDAKELKGLVERGYVATHGALPADWDNQYKNMPIEQRKSYVKNDFTADEQKLFKEIIGDKMVLQGSSTKSGQGITNLVNQMITLEQERTTKKAATPGDSINRAAGKPIAPTAARTNNGTVRLVSGTVADDALTSGPRSLLHYYQQRQRNLPLVLKTIETQLNEARAEQARTAEGGDTSMADARVAELEDMLELWTETGKFLPDMIRAVNAKVAVLTDENIPIPDRIQELDELNQQLDQFYRSDNDAVALAASMLRLRSPYDNVGSFHVGPAAVSLASVKDGVEMGVETDWASLDVTTADFDGDRLTSATGIALGRNSFRRARSGASWLSTERDKPELGPDGKPLGPETAPGSKTLYKVAAVAPDELISTTAHHIHTGMYLPAIQDLPGKWLRVFADAVVHRYSPQYTRALSDQLYNALESRLLTVKPKDPIKELMRFFATDPTFSPAMVKYGSTNNTNEPSVLTGMFRSYMDSLQVAVNQHSASLIPPSERVGAQGPAAQSTRSNVPDQHRKIAPQQGATLLSTFFQYYGSQDMLRVGQVIRLSHKDYKDRGLAKADTNPLLDIAGREMRVLSQGHIQDAAKAGLSEFDIPARVRAMALDITNGNEAAAFNLLTKKFGDIQFDGKDKVRARRNVTVAQALTMSYVQQLRVDAAVAISRDPQLQMKLDLLERAANDARGFDDKKRPDGEMMILRDALGAFNLADLLGVGVTADWATSGLLITGSIEQNIRLLAAQPRVDVASLKRAMLAKEVPSPQRDLYESIVNLIVEVANTENARTSKRNETSSKAALAVRQNVREALRAAKLPQTREGVHQLLDSQEGMQILAGLISETRIASFTDSTAGGTSLRDWVLEFFVEENDGRAEVLLWSNRAYDNLHLNIARRRMKDRDRANFGEERDEQDDPDIRLDDSLAALMDFLRKHHPDGLRDLQIAIGQASDRKSLEEWIAAQPWGFKAPVFMYENSMAQFDPTLASGGWGVTGTSYGAAMRELVQPSKTFRDRTTKQVKYRAANVATASRLLSELDTNPNAPQVLQLLREAEQRRLGAVKTMHPNDMLDSALRAQYIATHVHDKGIEHEAVAGYGGPQVAEAIQTGFTDPFIDSANQLLDVRDISDLRQRPELVFSTSKFTDEYGHPVLMPRLLNADGGIDIRAVLEAIANDAETGLADILVEAILPRQYTFNRETGLTSVVALGPRTLEELVTQRYAAAFKSDGPGRYTKQANASLGAEVSAAVQTQDFNYAAAFERAWQAIAMPRVMGSRGWSKKRTAAEYETVRNQLGVALRQAGFLRTQNPEDYANTIRDVVNNLVLEMNLAQNQRAQGRGKTTSLGLAAKSETRKQLETMMQSLLDMARESNRKDRVEFIRDTVRAIEAHESGAKRLSDAEVNTLISNLNNMGNLSTPMITLLESVLHDEPFAGLHYAYGQGDIITMDQREAITEYLNSHPEIANQINHDKDAAEAMAWFNEPMMARDGLQWSMLSRIVISHVVQSDAIEGWSTTDKLQVFKDDTFLDPTYSLLLKKMFDPDSPLIAAMVGITAGRPEVYTTADLHKSLTALYPTDGSVRWDQSIGAQMMATDATYAASSPGAAAPVHANSGKTIDALAMAAYTTADKVPPPELLRTATLRRDPEGLIGADTAILEGAVGTVTINGQPVNLEVMVGSRVAPPYQVITSRRLELAAPMGATIEVQYFHPLDRPLGSEWTNNIHFDGVVAYDSPQTNEFPSLIAALYNQANGILQLGTRFVLDAVKNGLPSVHRTHVDANGNWNLQVAPDPTIYLMTLARSLAVATNLGYPALGKEWMRPALKYVTMRHVVQYADGSVTSVYEYIAQQQLDPEAMFARGPKLIALSERAANTFYGETGAQGLRGFPLNGRLTAGSQAFSWSALTPRQEEVVRNMGTAVPLSQTSAARRQVLSGAGAILPAAFSDAVQDLVSLSSLMMTRDSIQAKRAELARKRGIKFTEMRAQQSTIANSLALQDNSTAFGLPDELEEMLATHGYGGFEFSTDSSYHLLVTSKGQLLKGIMTPTNYRDKDLGSLTFGDTAVIDLANLTNVDTKTLVEMVRQLTLAKVTISLRGVSANEHTRAVTEYLRALHDYSSPIDQKDTFAPRETVNEYQLETAYESRLQQQGFSSAFSKLMTLVPTGVIAPEFGNLAESQGYILDEGQRFVANNVLLKQYPSVKATPLHPADVTKVSKMLLDMEAELRAAKVDGEIVGLTHDQAVTDLMARARNNALPLNTENLELRKGMYEVYVVPGDLGSEMKLYLHRAGSRFIQDERLDQLRTSGKRFELGPTETEADQTFVEGLVIGRESTGTSDLLLTVKSSHKWYGAKRIPLLGGDKGQYTVLPKNLDWVRGAVAGELRPQEITNEADAIKKLNMIDMVGTFSQMAEVLGFDNMPIFFRGAYGEQFNGSQDHISKMDQLRDALNNVRKDSAATPSSVQRRINSLAGSISGKQTALLAMLDPQLLKGYSTELNDGAEVAEVGAILSAIAYLTIPGTSLSDIEFAGGFTTPESRMEDRGSYYMPNTFTSYYDKSESARKLVQEIFQSKLERGIQLMPDYTLRKWFNFDADGNATRFQDFKFGYVVRSITGEAVGESFDPTVKRALSSHNARLGEQFGDVLYGAAYSSDSFEQFVQDATTRDIITPLRQAPPPGRKNRPHYNMGPNQQTYRGNVARMLSHYFNTIDLRDEGDISEPDAEQLEKRIRDIAQTLFNDSTGRSDHHVHTLLRLALGRPAADPAKPDEAEASRIKLSTLKLALKAMEANIKQGYSPLRRGAVSLMPLEIRNAIIAANYGKAGRWSPRIYNEDQRISDERAKTPDEFTRAFFDHALADIEANDIPVFKQIMDAVFHQYQQTSADLQALPVSLDMMRDLDLLRRDLLSENEFKKFFDNPVSFAKFSEENPDLVKSSLYFTTEQLLTPQIMHRVASSATMAQQIGLADPALLDLEAPTAELLQYVENRYASYARRKDIPFGTKASTRALRDTNSTFTDNHSNSHRFFRNLLALHAAKALFQPALAVGALIESRMRMTLEDTRRMLTGESIGPVGRRLASVVESQGRAGVLARGLGWRVMYTDQQARELKRILNSTALTSVVNDVIYAQLASYSAELSEQGVVKPLVKLTKISNAMQDLGHGTKGKTMRRNYMQAAITDLVLRKGQSLDAVLAAVSQDGAWIDRNFKDSSNAGIQAMNDLRGTRDTMTSSAISAVIDPLTHSGNAGVNAVAQMTLAMPLMFQRYAANLFLTLTGAKAIDQLAAHALNGRNKPGFWGAISSKARSENLEANPTINLDDVIAGVDAMDAVINMGITHSLLFTGGMVLGGLGLGGEDEEERRRRRAAAAQGAVWLSDPREIENDFRNAHALFLDEIPGLNALFRNDAGRAVVSPHWIIKPLTSPLLGMERFFETGDIRQLKWGFEDAITSMPLFNTLTFNKAVTMSEELSHAAQDSAASGNPGASDTAGFLTHLVAYYEHALFESSFLNALYTGFDDYDRDPYVMPLRNPEGELQRDAEGNVRANADQHLSSEGLNGRGLALQTYVDDEGKVQQGYWTESGASTDSRILAENRLSYALISSLFTGLSGKGMNTRFDQAVKTREVDKPELTGNEKKEAVLRAIAKEGGAKLLADEDPSAEQAIALSLLNHLGEEVLTLEGKKAVVRGLAGGSVTADDQALLGVYLTYEERQELQDFFLDELAVEGMRNGLSESSAKYRAQRVWNGDGGAPAMATILWDKNIIPYSKTQEFQQLNTTYMMGPDGNVWATGFTRQKLLGAMGLAPLQGMHTSEDTHTDMDERMNVSAFGINNTGMRSLRPVNNTLDTPTDAEIGDAITRAIEDLNNRSYRGGSGGFGGYGGFGGFGGGGGGGYAQRPVNKDYYPPRWTNLNYNPFTMRVPYANDTYSVRTDDVRTDLSLIRRERISSERNRLSQWQ